MILKRRQVSTFTWIVIAVCGCRSRVRHRLKPRRWKQVPLCGIPSTLLYAPAPVTAPALPGRPPRVGIGAQILARSHFSLHHIFAVKTGTQIACQYNGWVQCFPEPLIRRHFRHGQGYIQLDRTARCGRGANPAMVLGLAKRNPVGVRVCPVSDACHRLPTRILPGTAQCCPPITPGCPLSQETGIIMRNCMDSRID